MGWIEWDTDGTCPVPGYGHYRLQHAGRMAPGVADYVGRGGQGVVYSAINDRLPQFARVIKFPHRDEWGDDSGRIELFIQESELGMNMAHTHLAHTIEVLDLRLHRPSEEWPPVAMVMEYFPCTLRQLTQLCRKQGFRVPAPQTYEWARQLADGLQRLHHHYGYVHRDLTDNNVMFRLASGRHHNGRAEDFLDAEAVLTDFGTIAQAGTRSATIVCRREADLWKDPNLYPLATDPGRFHQAQACETSMDIFAFGAVLRTLHFLTYRSG